MGGLRSRRGFFVDWCQDGGIDNLNELSAPDLHESPVWRREDLTVASERCNVTPSIIDEQYDVPSADDKMQQRQHVLERVWKESGDGLEGTESSPLHGQPLRAHFG